MSTQPLLPKPSTQTTTNPSPKSTTTTFPPLWQLPIKSRPPIRSPLFNRLFLFPTFIIGSLSVLAFQTCFYPVWALFQVVGGGGRVEEVLEWAIERSKQGFVMLMILCLQWFAPTTITLSTPTSSTTLPLSSLLTTSNPPSGSASRILLNLPENLIIVSNHQSHLDWIWIWILGHWSVSQAQEQAQAKGDHSGRTQTHAQTRTWRNRGHGSKSLICMLKKSLKKIPILGWAMTFGRFIFLSRSWAQDQQHLTLALSQLASRAKSRPGAGLWLLIFPEGTITSDEEREKSVRFSKREGMPDYVNLLHPRVTGLQFCLKTLLPQIPDLKILDVTIGYPGVTRGGYAQEWYGLPSVFKQGISPPTIHIHLNIIDPATESIPGIPAVTPSTKTLDALSSTNSTSPADEISVKAAQDNIDNTSTPTEADEFGSWLRDFWKDKEILLDEYIDGGWKGFSRPGAGSTGTRKGTRSLEAWGVGEEEEEERKRRLFAREGERVELPVKL